MNDVKDISKQPLIEWGGQVVITTAQLAEVYGATPGNITDNFNGNKGRFIEGKHYIFLTGSTLKEFKNHPDFSGVVAKNASQLYLWTRRGASRHCKILGTDKAWEQFDYLEENYFDRRESLVRLPQNSMELLELHYKALKEVDGKVNALSDDLSTVRKDLEDFKNDMPILGIEESKITNAVKKRGVEVLGGKASNAYNDKSLRGRLYSDLHRQLRREFGVSTYKGIKRNQTDTAIRIIQKYAPPLVLAETIEALNAQQNFNF